jgi:hypothetical protein
MKNLFLFLLVISVYSTKAQEVILPTDSVTGKTLFMGIVKVDSVSKDELYNRASTWFAKSFNSAQNVLQKNDRVDGVLIGRALFLHYMKGLLGENIQPGNAINYTISVYTKDGRYKYEITDFIYDNSPYGSSEIRTTKPNFQTKKYWNNVKQHCLDEANLLISSLKEEMNKPVSSKNDW